MPKYCISLQLTQTVIQRYWEEFDTSDQDAWDSLRSRVAEDSEIDINNFPTEAPADPNVWLDLYKNLEHTEYENQDDDDCISDRNGSTDYSYTLEDESGEKIIEDDDI